MGGPKRKSPTEFRFDSLIQRFRFQINMHSVGLLLNRNLYLEVDLIVDQAARYTSETINIKLMPNSANTLKKTKNQGFDIPLVSGMIHVISLF